MVLAQVGATSQGLHIIGQGLITRALTPLVGALDHVTVWPGAYNRTCRALADPVTAAGGLELVGP